ncbi:MAG: hypothetical protein RL074_1496 [Bacteroidota bacterium]
MLKSELEMRVKTRIQILKTSEDICKSAEDDVQNLTNAYIKKIDELLVEKEAEIMKV